MNTPHNVADLVIAICRVGSSILYTRRTFFWPIGGTRMPAAWLVGTASRAEAPSDRGTVHLIGAATMPRSQQAGRLGAKPKSIS